jgi:hypothetical protein
MNINKGPLKMFQGTRHPSGLELKGLQTVTPLQEQSDYEKDADFFRFVDPSSFSFEIGAGILSVGAGFNIFLTNPALHRLNLHSGLFAGADMPGDTYWRTPPLLSRHNPNKQCHEGYQPRLLFGPAAGALPRRIFPHPGGARAPWHRAPAAQRHARYLVPRLHAGTDLGNGIRPVPVRTFLS